MVPLVETEETKMIRKIIRDNDEKISKQDEERKSRVVPKSKIIPAGKNQQYEGGLDIATVPMPQPEPYKTQ